MVKSMSKEKQTFFNVTKGQISNFLRAVEHCASPGFNYCYAMQNVYTKDAWFVPCEYGYSYAVFGYCAFEYWIRELLRLIEVGASCFNHYCVSCDVTQLNVLHNVHRRISLG